jgi:hypothetical protein
MKKTIIIIGIFLVLFGAIYFLWTKRYTYLFQGELGEKEESPAEEIEDNEKNNAEDGTINGEEANNGSGEGTEYKAIEEGAVSDEIINEAYEDILRNHCGNQCAAKKDTGDYQYCLEICGLRDPNKENIDDCENLSGLEKDVCYKNKAIEEKNYDYCGKIMDVNLKASCENRVLEEIL